MRHLTKACLLLAAAVCIPVQARAEGYVTPWIGAGGLSSTDAGRTALGVTAGYMAAGILGFEGDFGYAPDFFGLNELGKSSAITTAGNLVFIGATVDSKFRAFDARNGKELWSDKVEAPAHAIPSTYMGRDGKQYVVIAAGGGGFLQSPTSDTVVAYALK